MLTAEEAAARLGVKRDTLYAYVSRGLIGRQVALDGRTSLFDADEIASFRSRRRRAGEGELGTIISSRVTSVNDQALLFRGRDVSAMIADRVLFEDAVNWLWQSTQPWPESEHPDRQTATRAAVKAQKTLPNRAALIDRLRMSVTVASAFDPLRHDLNESAVYSAGRQMICVMVDSLPIVSPGEKSELSGSVADRLWPRLSSKRPTAIRRQALNGALVALADHGLASSTFGVRVAGSVRADPYSAVHTGLGIIGGSLHGAASMDVHDMFVAAEMADDVAEEVGRARRRTGHTPGFGHMVYTTQDPRYGAVMAQVVDGWSRDRRLATIFEVRDIIQARSDELPNIDFAVGALSYLAGATSDSGEAIMAIARTAGWIAHMVEELNEQPLRFRPKARYVGRRDDPGSK